MATWPRSSTADTLWQVEISAEVCLTCDDEDDAGLIAYCPLAAPQHLCGVDLPGPCHA